MKKSIHSIFIVIISSLIAYMGVGITMMPKCCTQEGSECIPLNIGQTTDNVSHDCRHCMSSSYDNHKKCDCKATLYKEILTKHSIGKIVPQPHCMSLCCHMDKDSYSSPYYSRRQASKHSFYPPPPTDRQTILIFHQVLRI